MANYYGHARTNRVKVKDREGLLKALEPWSGDFDIHWSELHENEAVFLLVGESGGVPSSTYDEDDNEIVFSWETVVMPYIEENCVLVLQEAGAEKLRYIIGFAEAYIRRGDVVSYVIISLDDIYQLAETTWDLPRQSIDLAQY